MAAQAGYYHCTCIALDVQAYGGNNDRKQSEIQHNLPRLLSRAALNAGLDRSRWHIQPKGDEQLAVAPSDGCEPRIVDDYVRHIVAELAAHNEDRVSTARMRLRAAVHHGPVEVADNGFAGQAVVTTCRLLNSAPLRAALTAAPAADLVLLLSDEVYRSTVAGGHTTLLASAFRRLEVQEKEYESAGWLWVPGHDVGQLQLDHQEFATTAQPGTQATDGSGEIAAAMVRTHVTGREVSVNNFNAPVDLRGGVVGFGRSNG